MSRYRRIITAVAEGDSQRREIVETFDRMYPVAGSVVDSRKVRPGIPNLDSIAASLDDYEILRGIRQFPVAGFGGACSFYAADDHRHCLELAKTIGFTREIHPIIVVQERQGPYVLEGSHRISALVELQAQRIPALIVLDMESLLEEGHDEP